MPPSDSGKPPVTIDPGRLSAARGGDVVMRVSAPLAPDFPLQHNELLITGSDEATP
jgi:hypothetical protein